MTYMRREERKDQIILAMLAALDNPNEHRLIAGVWRRGGKRSWTAGEIAKEIGLVRSTRLYGMLNELVKENSLYRLSEPYESGGITNYRWIYQVREEAYIQTPIEYAFISANAKIGDDCGRTS